MGAGCYLVSLKNRESQVTIMGKINESIILMIN